MFDTQSLATFAQVGLGLAGFSGVGILLTRSSTQLLRFEVYRLGIMLGITLGATFLALLPLVLHDFGLRPETTCRIASTAMAVFSVAFVLYFSIAIRYMLSTVPEIVSRPGSWSVVVGHSVNMLIQVTSAFGLQKYCAGFYSLGLMWLLIHGAYQFWRILFIRPPQVRAAAADSHSVEHDSAVE